MRHYFLQLFIAVCMLCCSLSCDKSDDIKDIVNTYIVESVWANNSEYGQKNVVITFSNDAKLCTFTYSNSYEKIYDIAYNHPNIAFMSDEEGGTVYIGWINDDINEMYIESIGAFTKQ